MGASSCQQVPNSTRPGVPQYEQIHIILKAGLIALEEMLPGFLNRILEAGGKPVNWLTDNRAVHIRNLPVEYVKFAT